MITWEDPVDSGLVVMEEARNTTAAGSINFGEKL
jgi:hypothetical protein